jgi:hypothetical protein
MDACMFSTVTGESVFHAVLTGEYTHVINVSLVASITVVKIELSLLTSRAHQLGREICFLVDHSVKDPQREKIKHFIDSANLFRYKCVKFKEACHMIQPLEYANCSNGLLLEENPDR